MKRVLVLRIVAMVMLSVVAVVELLSEPSEALSMDAWWRVLVVSKAMGFVAAGCAVALAIRCADVREYLNKLVED